MPERPSRVERLEDAFLLASPLSLVRFLKLLGVRQTVIAARLSVPTTNVSMWLHLRQPVPQRYGPALRVWAIAALNEQEVEWGKALRESPTADDRDRLVRLYYEPISQWVYRVHLEAGTYDAKMRAYIAQLAAIASQPTLSAQDNEDVTVLASHLMGMATQSRAAREAQAAQTAAEQEEKDEG